MTREKLREQFELSHNKCHASNEHLPVFRALASECASVTEIGLEIMDSSWGLLQGLSESTSPNRSYLGIDCRAPPIHIVERARRLSQGVGISFTFWQINDLEIERLAPVDLLFIDGLHTYCHLLYELEKFSSQVEKYIVMHDTEEPWGHQDEIVNREDYSKYFPDIPPGAVDWSKKGLREAVASFLERHSREWVLHEHRTNNHGLTTLRRIAR